MSRLQRVGWFVGDVADKVMGGTKSDRNFAKMGKEAQKSAVEKKKIYFRVFIYELNGSPIPMLVLCHSGSNELIEYKTLTGNEISFIKNAIRKKSKSKSKLNDLKSVKGYIRGSEIGSEMVELKSFQRAPDRDAEQLFNSGNFYDLNKFMSL